jgi:hypothetical protein
MYRSKLACLFRPNLIFASKAKSVPSVESRGSPRVGSDFARRYDTKMDVKVTNALAYYGTALIASVKSFIACRGDKT